MAYGEGAYGEGVYGGGTRTYSSEVLADSPWGFWEFAETTVANTTLADAGSNATAFARGAGIVVGKTALVADGGTAVSGSGAAEIGSLGTIPASLAGASVTFEAWVNIPDGNLKGAFFDLGTVPSNGWAVGIGNSTFENAGRQLILLHEAVAWKPTGYSFTSGTHHIAVTRSSGNLFTVYVDGTSVYTSTFTPNAPTGKVWIGGGSNGSTRALSSTITMDNFALYASELSAARISAHYNAGAGDNAAVSADAPVVWLKLDDTGSASFADSSPNARPLSYISGTPTIGTGPGTGYNGVDWPTDAYARTDATLAEPTSSTYEAWVYLTAAPGKDTPILVVAPTSGSSGNTSGLAVDSLGKVMSYHYPGAIYKTTDPLTFGAWHHVVTSTGAAGSKIRVDGVTVASSATTSDTSAATGVVWLHAYYNGASIVGGGPVQIGAAAFWPSQLSDARTDAHRDAMLLPSPASGTISAVLPLLSATLSGGVEFSGDLAATLPALGADLSGTSIIAGVAGTLSATFPPLGGSLVGAYSDAATLTAILPPLSADLAGTSALPPVSGTLAATLPALRSNLAGQSFKPGIEGYIEALLPALTASLSGDVLGRSGLGLALDSSAVLTEPEPTVPPGTPSTALHIIAPTVPVPTLVAGRPQ